VVEALELVVTRFCLVDHCAVSVDKRRLQSRTICFMMLARLFHAIFSRVTVVE
jgi:hypothetical protein